MPYRLKRDEEIAAGIRRIAGEQIERAVHELDDPKLKPARQVHQVRKRCKKLRGLLRLVRPAMGEAYSEQNAWLRDTASALAGLRDAKVLLDTYDAVASHFGDQINRRAFGSVRRALTWRRKRLRTERVDLDARLKATRKRLLKARRQVADWPLDGEGFDLIAGGLLKNYGRARKRMPEAYESGQATAFHEWRKRVKYHWHHCRLLEDAWPQLMTARQQEAKRLADFLGDANDLAVLREEIQSAPDDFGAERDVAAFLALVHQRTSELRTECHPLGQRLLAESKDEFVNRVHAYWLSG